MKERELSKLQIRSEITLMLQKINSVDEMSREQQLKYIAKLGSISNRDYVIDILLKELGKVTYQKAQIISLFLQEFATLDQAKDVLWGYIKSPETSDETKDIAGITLKNLGDVTDPEEFLAYLDDPKSVVDKETKKLLETASINPEAQIDFLDFLFSLPEPEQLNLVMSLKEDYSSEYIASVIVPALQSRFAPHMDEYLLDILGESRSPRAVGALNDVMHYYRDEKLAKKAKINLNKLKLAGVDTEEPPPEISKISDIYECHTCIPDGMGNQAIIVSRIKPNGDILMMNTIINDVYGIMDCFGFYGISRDDFRRIIERFQEKGTRFLVPSEYCRYLLENAEKINKQGAMTIPYEYLAWKTAIKDIEQVEYPRLKECADAKYLKEADKLRKFPDFERWFFEEDDHAVIKEKSGKLLENLIINKELYLENTDRLNIFIENQINELMLLIFDQTVREVYRKRLLNVAILFNITELTHFSNIAASLAWAVTPESGYNITDISFIRKIVRKTVIEGLIRYEHNLFSREQQKVNSWAQKKAQAEESGSEKDFEKKSIQEILEVLL